MKPFSEERAIAADRYWQEQCETGQLNSRHMDDIGAAFEKGYNACLKSQVVRAMQEALLWADEMFTARDEMNAKVHCAPLRLSPITERVKQAIAAYEQALKEIEK